MNEQSTLIKILFSHSRRLLLFALNVDLTMPKRGNKRKKTRTHTADTENVAGTLGAHADVVRVPKSLVVSCANSRLIVLL
jgi:hypothetical protein